MKKLYCLLVGLLVAVGLGSCSSSEEETLPSDTYQLNFQVINYEQISLNSYSRAGGDVLKPYIVMAIYDSQTNKLVATPTIHAPGSAEGGSFSAKLPKREYNFVFLAYYTSRTLFPEDPTAIYWDAQMVDNTFLKTINLSVDEGTDSGQEILLSRAVGVFTMNSKGTPVPENFDHFRIRMQEGGHRLNALTGFTGADATREYIFNSQKNYAGTETITQSGYAFLPRQECNVDITLIAEDKDNKPIRTRTFTNVPMKINQQTRYTGDFFSENVNNDFSVKLEEKPWEEVDITF